jgi:ribosomal protein L37E
MGEFADMELDRLFDSYAHDHGGLSSYGRDFPTSIRCKRCGSGPFDWAHVGWKNDANGYPEKVWRLMEDEGVPHVCPPPSPKSLGFEDIA